MINNYNSKGKTYIGLEKININRKSQNTKRKKEKDKYLTIAFDSQPKTVIATPTYNKLSTFSSPRSVSKNNKKETNNNIRYLTIEI